MAAISIITPVYKVEKYIDRCINSILNQTFSDWELILVDDGSPDNSGVICDDYAKKDTRIKVLHKANGGVSSARNLALAYATGEYVTFVDSDDWISPECLTTCMNEMRTNGVDILQFGFHKINHEGDIHYTRVLGSDVLSVDEYVEFDKFNLCAAGSIIKSSIIHNNCIKFIEGIKYAEDQLFLYNCMLYVSRIKSIPQCFYYYFENETSATSVKQRSDDLVASIEQLSRMSAIKSVYRKPVQNQIQIFLERILVNHDVTAKKYNFLFEKYFDPNIKLFKALQLYRALYKLSPYLTYTIFGRYYSYYHK